jgi:hypothetical protein
MAANALTPTPGFDRTRQRFDAWWNRAIVDRPLLTVFAKPARPYRGPVKQHATAEDYWFDIEYRLERRIAELEQLDYVGDFFPWFFANLGPEITGTLLGATLGYLDEETGWAEPVVHEVSDWQRIIDTKPDFDNRYWRTMERMTQLALDACDGRYVVGITDLHGNYDILASLREPEDLCLDMMDDPELVRRAGAHVSEIFAQAFERCYALLAAAGHPCTTWCPMLHDGPAYLPSCDFWCMVSPRIAREMILPDIVREMRGMERTLFHLDGPDALGHLDALLEIEQLDAVQWVYGAGHGPAARWMDVLKRIQTAGKGIQICVEDPADAMAVMEQLRPEGVWLLVNEPFDSTADAQAFVDQFA